MDAKSLEQTANLTTAGLARWGAGTSTRERNFYIALACAAILHASAFVGVVAHKPKELGDPSGADNAISVSLVTEADLQSRSTVAEEAQAPPSPPPKPVQQDQPKPPEPQPKAEQQPSEPPTPSEADTSEPQPPTPVPPQPDVAKPTEQQVAKQEDPKVDDSLQDLLSLQGDSPDKLKSEEAEKPKAKPVATPKPTASKPPSKPRQKRLSELDLSAPDVSSFPGGRSAGFQRPPGITKSGLNDAFARAVIRALQQTMPQLSGANGRVTVRIFLSESGNVVEVKLLAAGKDATLSQEVVFAARQTSYPIPPVGSNTADRTFMVTYVYD